MKDQFIYEESTIHNCTYAVYIIPLLVLFELLNPKNITLDFPELYRCSVLCTIPKQ